MQCGMNQQISHVEGGSIKRTNQTFYETGEISPCSSTRPSPLPPKRAPPSRQDQRMRILLAYDDFEVVNLNLFPEPFRQNRKETAFGVRVTTYTILTYITFICIDTYIKWHAYQQQLMLIPHAMNEVSVQCRRMREEDEHGTSRQSETHQRRVQRASIRRIPHIWLLFEPRQ